jgi:arylsulfatase A-like enzyme
MEARVAPLGPSAVARTADDRGCAFLVATWFGLATGLLEGAGFIGLQTLGWLGRRVVVESVTPEVVWISTLFNLLLFNAVGLALLALTRSFPRLPLMALSISVFSVMACEDLLVLTLDGHLHLYAVILLGLGCGVTVSRWLRKHETVAVRFGRRTLPALGATALVALVGIQGGYWARERLAISALPSAGSNAPNVLVIVADTLRADHLSAYGYPRPTSPNIDRIARDGVLFENAFATCSWTAPSHASLLTGLYPSRHGVELRRPRRSLNEAPFPTIAEGLRERGYRTAAFSANLFWFTRTHGFQRGFIRFEDYFQSIPDMAVRPIYGRAIEKLVFRRFGFEDIPARRRAADINRSLLRWIDRDRDRPFFAFVNYMDTHDPYLPPRPYRSRFSRLANPGGLVNEHIGRAGIQLTAAQQQGEIDAYDGAIAYLDDHIGTLVEELRIRGLTDKTLLVITADHGESLGEHGLLTHGSSLFSGEVRVPLIFAGPAPIQNGVRVTRPVTNAALAATVMDLVGGDPAVFRRMPLRQLWERPEAYPNWEYPMAEIGQVTWAPANAPTRYGSMRAVITPRWHYILHEKRGAELYDRESDPRQQTNLAERPEMQRVVESLRAQLVELLADGDVQTSKR